MSTGRAARLSNMAAAFPAATIRGPSMANPAGPARFVPHAALTAMIAIWGISYAVVKTALASLPAFGIVALRFWLAVLCLLPFLLAGGAADLRRCAGPGTAAGFLLALGYLLQTAGMNETSAAMGGLLAGLIVPLVAIGGFVLFRARCGPRAMLGLLLAVAGTVMLCATEPGGTDTLRGIGLQVGSSTSYAGHVLLLTRFGRTLPALPFCLWQLVIVAVAATVSTWLAGDAAAVFDATWTPRLALLIGYLGVFATALGIAVQSKVQHRIGPTTVALLFALQPVFAALFAFAALGDRMGVLQLAGGGVIVLAVVLVSLDRAPAALSDA